jgi:uncharacterized lipoprotein YmbA
MLTVLVISLAGCGRTASTRFYTLSAMPAGDPAPPRFRTIANTAIGIGPVNLPDYLDRPQIVIRTSPHELRLAEFDKWAGALKHAVPRVIAENLSTLLESDQIFIFPWKSALPIRYQVIIDINRFDAQMGSHADLEAQWTVFEDDGRTPIVTHKSKIRKPAKAADYAAAVQAESRVLWELSREIAATLVDIKRP